MNVCCAPNFTRGKGPQRWGQNHCSNTATDFALWRVTSFIVTSPPESWGWAGVCPGRCSGFDSTRGRKNGALHWWMKQHLFWSTDLLASICSLDELLVEWSWSHWAPQPRLLLRSLSHTFQHTSNRPYLSPRRWLLKIRLELQNAEPAVLSFVAWLNSLPPPPLQARLLKGSP